MPTWTRPAPKPNGYLCITAWHLKGSGLLLAIYDLIGNITRNGETKFFGSKNKVAQYFDANYRSVTRAFQKLTRLGFLERIDEKTYDYVPHSEWVKTHPNCCAKREVLTWEYAKDPLVGRLYAIAQGNLRLYEGAIIGIRKWGFNDNEILAQYAKQFALAEERKRKGQHSKTSPVAVFWQTNGILREQSEALERALPTVEK